MGPEEFKTWDWHKAENLLKQRDDALAEFKRISAENVTLKQEAQEHQKARVAAEAHLERVTDWVRSAGQSVADALAKIESTPEAKAKRLADAEAIRAKAQAILDGK